MALLTGYTPHIIQLKIADMFLSFLVVEDGWGFWTWLYHVVSVDLYASFPLSILPDLYDTTTIPNKHLGFSVKPSLRKVGGTEVQGRTIWVGHEIHGKEAILIQTLGI